MPWLSKEQRHEYEQYPCRADTTQQYSHSFLCAIIILRQQRYLNGKAPKGKKKNCYSQSAKILK